MPALRIPCATYRLQFNHYFTFKNALELIPYFHELGISDLYASPIMTAIPGSMHGYDVVDPCKLNPEIGTEEDLKALSQALMEHDMGLIVDIVPNHLSIATLANAWWQDVLENGPASLYADFFDINWNPLKASLKDKVLLPILARQFGKVIDEQCLKLSYDAGAFFIEYQSKRFPVNPSTWPLILELTAEDLSQKLNGDDEHFLELQSILTALHHLPNITKAIDIDKCVERSREKEIIKKRLNALTHQCPLINDAILQTVSRFNGHLDNPSSFDHLEKLLNAQSYRLCYWRVTNDEINYRRFFDVNDLISLHMEKPEIFHVMHAQTLSFLHNGWITGLRVDHIDGLFDPEQYLHRLQAACAMTSNQNENQTVSGKDFYILVEKILVGKEKLRSEWPVYGTTGYDFLCMLNGLFIELSQYTKIKEIYEQFIHRYTEMPEIIYGSKKLILFASMSSELHNLTSKLEKISEQHRWSKDFTLDELRNALREVIACFSVYRTYIRLDIPMEVDRQIILLAIKWAKKLNPLTSPSLFEFIDDLLLLNHPPGITDESILLRREFVMRFQQLTAPVMAKGEEDTAFYRYYPLCSQIDVGMDPNNFGTELKDFHKYNLECLHTFPHTLLATSTHDSKRSEDVRCRIHALSENPEGWNQALTGWNHLNRHYKILLDNREVPDRNEEYLLYQTLIGTWPVIPMDELSQNDYLQRIKNYMVKALREAKLHTSWMNPNSVYENGVLDFIGNILDFKNNNQFLNAFEAFVPILIKAGMLNSLSQTLLKMTSPGVPDFYQGNELWQFHLVDPDNRYPVDFQYRCRLLNEIKQREEQDPGTLVMELLENITDGLLKMYLIYKILNFRKQNSSLFREGDYQPVEVIGKTANHVIAFCRQLGEKKIIIAAGRFYTELMEDVESLPIGGIWEETFLRMPSGFEGEYRDVLTGLALRIGQGRELSLIEGFKKLPFFLFANS